MPTYDYICSHCANRFEDIKGIKAYSEDPSAKCPKCGFVCGSEERDFTKSTFNFIGTKVQSAEFNPGLGCVVKNKNHREELAKQKGLIEIGNDFSDGKKMQEHYKKKKREEKDAKWDKDPSDFFL